MTYLSILVGTTGESDDAAAVSIAADLGKRHTSVVTVCNTVDPMPAAALAPVMAGSLIASRVLEAVVDRRIDIAEAVLRLSTHAAGRFGLALGSGEGARMRVAEPAPTARIAFLRELPLADLVVVGASSAAGTGRWTGTFGELLMDARTPIFLARDGVSPAGRSAAIAWDGSLEAGRAVRAALPLLKDASDVAILQDTRLLDTSAGAAADPQRLSDFLTRHGVGVSATVDVRGHKVGTALLQGAERIGAALLVAGAYRHARLAEAIFGGATRAFLNARQGPHLFVAH